MSTIVWSLLDNDPAFDNKTCGIPTRPSFHNFLIHADQINQSHLFLNFRKVFFLLDFVSPSEGIGGSIPSGLTILLMWFILQFWNRSFLAEFFFSANHTLSISSLPCLLSSSILIADDFDCSSAFEWFSSKSPVIRFCRRKCPRIIIMWNTFLIRVPARWQKSN